MSDSAPGLITLLTDFGARDGYVGVMKGVIAGIHPAARTIDLSHEIPPQDIRSAAFLLERSFRYFPIGTVHVVVVDPGVGSERKGLIIRSEGHYFVGPDNGVFSGVLESAEVRSLTEAKFWLKSISNTFHGRDIFAPVAAHLLNGIPLKAFGPIHSDPMVLATKAPEKTSNGWTGEIVYIDRFGNLITNLERGALTSSPAKSVVLLLHDGSEWPVVGTYADVTPGSRCAVMGGFDRLELSLNGGDAASLTGSMRGSLVLLKSLS